MQEQKKAILGFAVKEKITFSRFIEIFPSSQKGAKERKIEILKNQLKPGDTLIVSDISRIGWSVAEIIRVVDTLLKNGVSFVAVEEGMNLNGETLSLRTQVIIRMFELFAQIEQKLITQKTKESLAVRKALGRNGGRPRTDSKKLEQARILYENSNQTAAEVCKAVGVGRRTFFRYLSERKQRLVATTNENP